MSGRSGMGRGQYKIQSRVGTKDSAVCNIAPAASSVASQVVEERSYTTGLTSLNLLANDAIVINPQTALASGLGIGWARCASAATLRIGWINASAGATNPTATHYLVSVLRRSA